MQPKQQKHSSLRHKLSRTFLATTFLASSQLLYGISAIAAPAPAGQIIQNKATGSFVDTDNSEQAIQSNIVQVTVAEVAGIQVTPLGVTGTPYLGNTIYFDFTVTNLGNDPTQFFIPSAPSTFTGGTPGTISVITYDPDGSGPAGFTPLSGVNVNSGSATGNLPNANTFNNGSIPAGGTLTIRVPMVVTATGNQPISVTLGNTPAAPNNQNQDYIQTTQDLYTFDNTGTTNGDITGDPINGDATTHRKEASDTLSIKAIPNISGLVFEDVNYGGGNGRAVNTSGNQLRPNVTVELYKSDGTFIATTTTSPSGQYQFTNITPNADYIVRVVNSTVTSSRGPSTGLIPVQTFRTDASVTAGVVTPIFNRVGGENPKEVDAPARSGTQTLTALNALTGQEVQSVTTVKVANTDATDIDFGFNFDTIVNTNNSGQGSLRQFILNSNALPNTGLDQDPNPIPAPGTTAINPAAGVETSIFMIPAANLNGTGANANTAVIALTSNFTITDAATHLDATTQTINIGNTNIGNVGTGGTVGVDGIPLATVPKPEVVLDFTQVPTNSNAILVQGQSTALKGFASYGYRTTGNLATLLKAAIVVQSSVTNPGATTITQLLGGTYADGSSPLSSSGGPVAVSTVGYTLQTAGAANISNNYLAYNSDAISFENTNGTQVNFTNNEVAENGPKDNNGSNASGIYADQIETGSGVKNITLQGNLIRNSSKPGYANAQGQGIQLTYTTFVTLENNTFLDNNVYGINASSSDTLIRRNIVTGTKNTGLGQGSGVVVFSFNGVGLRNRITENHIYQNAKLGIDHQVNGVSPNDGAVSATQPNNGMDYPIITSSALASGQLSLKGYVGAVAAGSPTFANLTLEFFVADDDGSNNGRVFITDPNTVSKPHGEGIQFIGSCRTDANGLFAPYNANGTPNCLFTVGDGFDAKLVTATATDAAGNTSEFSTFAVNSPSVLLVKRITRINGSTSSYLGQNLATYNEELSNIFDDNEIESPVGNPPLDPPDTNQWPNTTGRTSSTFLVGGVDGGMAKPGDEVEYTIYFLSTGDQPAKNVQFCDRIPDHQTFVPNSFSTGLPAAPGGLSGPRGISVQQNGTESSYTNIGGDDTARFYDPNGIFPAICNGSIVQSENNGAVFVDLGDVPNATTAGTPGSYGFVRFRVKMK